MSFSSLSCRRAWVFLVLLYGLTMLGGASGQALPVCVEWVMFMGSPTGFGAPPGNNQYLFFGSVEGEVIRYDKTTGAQQTVLDLSTDATTFLQEGESGLLNLAFHPDFQTNNLFYILQSVPTGVDSAFVSFEITNTTVYEYRMFGDFTVDTSYRRLVISIWENDWHHNGGSVLFGPSDGMMYITTGDGGGSGAPNAQDGSNLLGKVLRIDISQTTAHDRTDVVRGSYGIPADNPFLNDSSIQPEIFALGYRNPFECFFDRANQGGPENGPIYCGDVGEDDFEYAKKIERGDNHGWPLLDGVECFNEFGAPQPETSCGPELTRPLVFYTHGTGGGYSIMGGPVYRGRNDPRLLGRYLFSDFSGNRVCPVWNPTLRIYEGTANCGGQGVPANTKTFAALSVDPVSGEFENVAVGVRDEQPLENFYLVHCTDDAFCPLRAGEAQPSNSYGWGEDNDGEVYMLSNVGVHLITDPTFCGISLNATRAPSASPTEATPSPTFVHVPQVLRQPALECPSSTSGQAVTLQIVAQRVVNQAFEVTTRTYNGNVPGPTIAVRPGETLTITLVNTLGPENPGTPTENTFHSPNTTNLHIHGLDVSPSQDDVFATLAPGGNLVYTYNIPEDHPSGSFWYHPHFHGSGAIQVSGGMAGAFIVLDKDDSHNFTALEDYVLLLQTFDFEGVDDEGNLIELTSLSNSNQQLNLLDKINLRKYTLVNGQYLPKIQLRLREAARLRFISATSGKFIYPAVPNGCNMTLIAMDGVYLNAPQPITRTVLPPGARADVIMQCFEAGLHVVASEPASNSQLGSTNDALQDILYLEVNDAVAAEERQIVPATLPARPAHLSDLQGLTVDNSFAVSWGFDNSINSVRYTGSPLETIALDELQEWTISAGDSVNHPYHQHVNRFQLIGFPGDGDADALDRVGMSVGMWRDTIPSRGTSTTVIRFRPQFFVGSMLIHCHVLSHAEQGMMAVIAVSGTAAPPPVPLLSELDPVSGICERDSSPVSGLSVEEILIIAAASLGGFLVFAAVASVVMYARRGGASARGVLSAPETKVSL